MKEETFFEWLKDAYESMGLLTTISLIIMLCIPPLAIYWFYYATRVDIPNTDKEKEA